MAWSLTVAPPRLLPLFMFAVDCKHTLVVTSAPAYLFTPVEVTITVGPSKFQVVCPAVQLDYMCGQSVSCGTVDVTKAINTFLVSVRS